MRVRRLIAAAVIGLGVAALFLWFSGDDETKSARSSTEEDTDHPAGSPWDRFRRATAESAHDAGSRPKKSSSGKELELREVHIRGIVLENRAPASDATVSARADYGVATATAQSGSDGRFELDLLAMYIVRLDALKGSNLRGSTQLMVGRPSPKEVRIELKYASTVIAVVTSRREGGPTKEARVSLGLRPDAQHYDRLSAGEHNPSERSFGPVLTDAEGRATLPILMPGRYEIEAEHDRLGVVVKDHTLSMSSTPQEIALELPGGSAVFGRVLNDSQQPIAGIEVGLAPEKRGMYGYRRATSDAEGRFRFEGVEAGHFLLDARPEKYVAKTTSIEKKDDVNDMEVDVVLELGGTIEGRVVDAREKPVAGWKILAAREADQHAFVRRTAVSKQDGSFVVDGCTPGTYVLSLSRPSEEVSYTPRRENPVRASPGDKDVVLHATDGAALHGEVRFVGADPPANYTVTVREQRKEQPGTASTFDFSDLSAGRVSVNASAPGFRPANVNAALKEGSTESVSLTLHPAADISGKVIDQDGPPIENALVRASNNGAVDDKVAAARTAADGTFVLEGVAPGKVELIVRADAYLTEVAGPFDTGPGAPPVVVKLRKGARVEGRVHAGPRPPRNGTVSISPASPERGSDSRDKPARGPDWRQNRTAALQDGGAFVLEGVNPGKNDLRVDAVFEEGGKSKNSALDVPASGLRGVDVDFAGGGTKLIASLPPATDRRMMLALAEGHLEIEPNKPRPQASWQHQAPGASKAEVVFYGLHEGEYTLVLNVYGAPGAPAPPRSTPIYVKIEHGQTEARVTVPAP